MLANWSNGVPNSSTDAYLVTTGTALVTLAASAASLYVGNSVNSGNLDVRSTLTATNAYIGFYGVGGNATVSSSGNLTALTRFWIGGSLGPGNLTIFNGGSVTSGSTGAGSISLNSLSGTSTFNLGRSNDTSTPGAVNAASITGAGTVNFLSNYAYTLAPSLTGSLNLAKSGPGTLTLTAASTYSGGTTITAGRLLVNNTTGSGLGTGAASVSSGASLGGTGSFSGPLTLNGTITPGSGVGPGALTTGDETWNSAAGYSWEINQATGSAGTNWDTLNIDGVLTIASTSADPFLIKVTSLTLSGTAGTATGFTFGQTYTWTLASSSSAITTFSTDKFTLDTSAFLNDATNLGTFALGLSPDSKSLTLSYTAVPEPGTSALLIGAGLLWLARRRRA